jgi:hypothetical protein
MKRYLTTLAMVASLGCAGHAFAQQKLQQNALTNAQLKTLLSNGISVRVTGVDRAGTAPRSGTAGYQKDGTARAKLGPASPEVVGSWKIDGNKFCTNYTSAGSGCFNLQKTGDKTYKLIPLDGSLEENWEILK